MDHAEALELMETAAAEPGGLDRLMAGDTVDAAALAGHLAACASCGRELARVRRTAEVVRETVRATPDPALRGRTLAYVRAVGRPSPEVARAGGAEASARRRGRLLPFAWAASVGATALLAAVIALAVLGPRGPVDDAADALARVTVATLRVEGQPDAQRVPLAGVAGSAAAGTVVFSPATGELVVVVTDLPPPPEGAEYRCWVETDEGRRPMGRMFFGGGIAYWAGPVDGLESVRDGSRFGVSLVSLSGDGADGEPVLVGELAS